MSILVTGDTHGTEDIGKLITFFSDKYDIYGKEDYLIICGDAGVCGFTEQDERETRRILRSLPVSVLFIDGNHEHFDQLLAYPVSEWNGGKVHIICEDIIHLMRGQVFEIGGKSFFTFGGADSSDKMFRRKGISWFPEELPNKQEYEEGWNNLEKHGFAVDHILTHTAPASVASAMYYHAYSEYEEELRQYLQRVYENTSFTSWYFGHFHKDKAIDEKFICLYYDITEL